MNKRGKYEYSIEVEDPVTGSNTCYHLSTGDNTQQTTTSSTGTYSITTGSTTNQPVWIDPNYPPYTTAPTWEDYSYKIYYPDSDIEESSKIGTIYEKDNKILLRTPDGKDICLLDLDKEGDEKIEKSLIKIIAKKKLLESSKQEDEVDSSVSINQASTNIIWKNDNINKKWDDLTAKYNDKIYETYTDAISKQHI